jgi:hypothetical protein
MAYIIKVLYAIFALRVSFHEAIHDPNRLEIVTFVPSVKPISVDVGAIRELPPKTQGSFWWSDDGTVVSRFGTRRYRKIPQTGRNHCISCLDSL